MAKKEKNTIDLPDVRDIPGQEHVRPPKPGEMADNTASSADEEGDNVFGPEGGSDNDLQMDQSSNVSADERAVLARMGREGADDAPLREGRLDSTDSEGEPLNEKGFGQGRNNEVSADDLDVPGSELDDREEALGEEDEENNDYSVSDNNDDTDINTDL